MAEGDIDKLVSAASGEARRQNFQEWAGKTRGMLAIAFTDLVDSTKMAVSLGDPAMAEVREAHFARSRNLIASIGGYEVKTVGDSVMAVFHTPESAFHYARALREDPGHPLLVARVRAGIHVGTMDITETDAFGVAVNYAARVIQAVAGPEIAVSVMAFHGLAASFGKDALERDWSEACLVDMKGFGREHIHFYSPAALPREPQAQAHKVKSSEVAPAATEASSLSLPDKPSIAVLPFQNMSGDPEQEYFADGIAEDIITLLSKSRGLFVIARNSSFTYRGRAVDVKKVGQELGVRYVLEGSVRRAANRVRVTAQLVEAATGGNLWAERYDRDLADIFTVQDEITASTSGAVLPMISHSERERIARRPPESLDAWECYQRGLWHLAILQADEHEQARHFIERAIALDPRFAAAHMALAVWSFFGSGMFYNMERRAEFIPSGIEHARTAIAIDPTESDAHAALAYLLVVSGRHPEAGSEADTAVGLNPNSAWAFGAQGYTRTFGGRPHEAIEPLKAAMRLSPFDPLMSRWLHHLARAHYFEGDYPAAISVAGRVCETYANVAPGYRVLLAALAQVGRTLEAKQVLSDAVKRFGDHFFDPMRRAPPELRSEDYQQMLDGYRKAGWEP